MEIDGEGRRKGALLAIVTGGIIYLAGAGEKHISKRRDFDGGGGGVATRPASKGLLCTRIACVPYCCVVTGIGTEKDPSGPWAAPTA